MKVNCEVSLGELVDKYSILTIKEKNISDADKLEHIVKEKKVIWQVIESLKLEGLDPLLTQLTEVNQKLWNIEDDIREKERAKEFDQDFIELARSVYITNDQRFEVKSQINQKYGSGIQEVKSYEEY